jgi:hypothetical protein
MTDDHFIAGQHQSGGSIPSATRNIPSKTPTHAGWRFCLRGLIVRPCGETIQNPGTAAPTDLAIRFLSLAAGFVCASAPRHVRPPGRRLPGFAPLPSAELPGSLRRRFFPLAPWHLIDRSSAFPGSKRRLNGYIAPLERRCIVDPRIDLISASIGAGICILQITRRSRH